MNRSRGPSLLAHNVEVLVDLAAAPASIATLAAIETGQ